MGLRLGLLSTARINRSIADGARASGAVDVVAVASRRPERAEAHASEHGIGRALGSCQLEDFAAAAAGERPPRFGRADAVSQARTLERLYASASRA